MTSTLHVPARRDRRVLGPGTVTALAVRVVGAGLVGATAAIHLHLYDIGYRAIPTIGSLFLVDVVAGAVLALALLAVPRRWLALVAFLAAGFEAATLAALLVTVYVGMFGFTETLDAPLVPQTLAVESAGALVLGAYALWDGVPRLRDRVRARRARGA